jgi:hypothetical protein
MGSSFYVPGDPKLQPSEVGVGLVTEKAVVAQTVSTL